MTKTLLLKLKQLELAKNLSPNGLTPAEKEMLAGILKQLSTFSPSEF